MTRTSQQGKTFVTEHFQEKKQLGQGTTLENSLYMKSRDVAQW